MIRRLFINTSSNLFLLVVNIAVTFVMAPIYLKNMGHYDYGLREMLLTFVGYMGMLSIGMRPTICRFASLHNAQNDRDALLTVYVSSLFFMGLLGMFLAVFFWVWAAIYPELLSPEDITNNVTKYRLFLLIIGVHLIFSFPKGVMDSYLEGLQRYYLKNMINMLFTLCIAIICYIFITPENALLLLTSLVAIQDVFKLLIFAAILSRPAMGNMTPQIGRFSGSKLKEMLLFGSKTFIQGASGKIESASDRLVIGTIIGPTAVPLYTIPERLVIYLKSITMNLTHAFMPYFSALHARSRQGQIQNTYLMASKMVVGLLVAMALCLCVIGGPFIDVWMPGQFNIRQVDMIIVLLTLYITIPYLNPFASRYLTAIGKHAIYAKIAPFAAFANLGVSIWLVFKVGVVGAALGSVFPVFVVMPIYLTFSCRCLGISVMQYLKTTLIPVVVPAVLMGVVIIGIRISWGLGTYIEIIFCAVIGALVYLCAFWLLSIKEEERLILMGWMKRAWVGKDRVLD
jgi:O-antigen/teichoic acid export membrane protein